MKIAALNQPKLYKSKSIIFNEFDYA